MADAFCLDGNRLRLTSSETLSTYGQPNTTYQTEIANFSNVTAVGTAGNGPSYFTVKGKDGLTYEYGNTTDSKIIPTTLTTPYVWALDKVTDRLGNQMTFTYYQVGGAYVPLSIQYAAPSGSTTFPYQVNFGYSPKATNDILSQYVASAQVQQTQQLSTITITNGGGTAREYKLLYTTSIGTLRATLTSIQECGGSGGTDCLSTTTVGYQSGIAGVASPTTATGSGATNGTLIVADIDGDGRQDLIYATTTSGTNYQWWVQYATATGYGPPISIVGAVTVGSANVLVDNFDATGGNEILAPIGGYWHVFRRNGTSFTNTNTNLPVAANSQYSSADVDGDGRPDLVYVTTLAVGANISIQLNTSTSTSIGFVTTPVTNSLLAAQNTGIRLIGNNQMANSSVKHMDFDGDGREDLVLIHNGPSGKGGSGQVALVGGLLSRGTAPFAPGPGDQATPSSAVPVEAVNWNDDACTDLVIQQILVVAACDGNYGSSIALPAIPALTLDWDGDGRTDLLANVGGLWELYRSEGTTYAPGIPTTISVGTGTWAVADKDGDGMSDLVFANSTASNAIYYGLHNGAGVHPDLATSFNDGYGNFVNSAYVSIVQSNYTADPYGSPVYPMMNFLVPLYVVSKATYSDPSSAPSGTYYQSFTYTGAWTDVQGRGFSNFLILEKFDSRNGLWETFIRGNSFPWAGILNGDQLSKDQAGNALISLWDVNNETFITLDATAHNQRYYPYYGTASKFAYELGGTDDGKLISTTTTNYTYDNYGNSTTVSTVVTDNDLNSPYLGDTWTTTTVNTITPNTSTWCLNLPTETTVTNSSTAPGGAPITRTVAFNSPDYTYCRETEKVIEPSSATYKVVEDYGYDTSFGNYGNLHTVTVTGVGMPARVTTISWTSDGHFPQTIVNPLSQTTTLTFDTRNGQMISQIDPNNTTANPLATSWTYDNFARMLSESRPDGTSTTWSYSNCSTNGCVNGNNKMTMTETAVNIGGSTLAVKNIYLDSADRALLTSSTMLNGAYDRNEIQYDSLGRVHQQGAPCTFVSCTNYWTTFGYDGLNRLTQLQRPFSAANSALQTTTIQYAGRTTTVTDPPTTADPSGRVTTKVNLVTGNMAKSMDQTGYYQTFTYDAFGSLLSVVDSASPANHLFSATYKYGVSAFQVTLLDADLGALSNTYDALGELIAYSDAKSQNVSITYDAISRPHIRTEPDLTTTWTWGNAATSFNIGKLQSVSAVSTAGTYAEAYGYDSKTRLSTDQITIPGDAAYTYTLTYSATTGLVDTLQYPVSTAGYQMKLQYAYQNGILQQISDVTAGTHYWTANAMNPLGQYTQETLGNNVVVTHALDAFTGWPNSIQAGLNGGSGVQNNSYLFDVMGNLTQRQDNNTPVVTENVYPDKLYRLDHTVGDTSTQMTYDAIGRIATWEAYGATANTENYTTPQSGCTYYADHAQPHAVRSGTQGAYTSSFCYDANGNMTTFTINGSNVGTYTWTSFNQPSDLSAGTSYSQFSYAADHQRYKQIASYSGAIETTIYVGGLLEKMSNSSGTSYRHYIPAGNNTVVYTRTSSGTNSTYYIAKDHLGSSAAITNQTGALQVKEKFSALGWNENTGAEQATMATISRHEFTGHEGIDNAGLGLVNMNGRIYVPSGSMFLSPDPHVTDPGNTQSFNRYSYVNNSPLSFTDPTGFDLDPITVNGSLGGPENPIADVASVGVALFDLGELFGWFGDGPTLTPNQKLAESHGLNLSSSLQGAPGFQSVNGTVSLASDNPIDTVPQIVVQASRSSYGIAQQFYSPFTVSAIASTAGVDPDQVRDLRVTTTRSQSPNELDQINVYARISSGFNWWNLAPGWSLLNCIYYGCGGGHFALAALGAIPFGSVESGVARGGLAAVRAGQAGEAAVRGAYNIGPKTAIDIAGRTRVPDGLLDDALSEVKNVNYLSYTQQLRDFTQYSLDNVLRFDLYVRPTTILSGPLQEAISSGTINLLFIP